MKKYQEYIIGKCITQDPPSWDFRVFYVQVEERDGRRVVCGEPIELTGRCEEPGLTVDEYEEWEQPAELLADIIPPEGWQLMAQFPLPDNYVPESMEVRGESRQRAIEHLRKLGVWRD